MSYLITLLLLISSTAFAAENSIKDQCVEKLTKSFSKSGQDLDRTFKGFYMCSEKGRALQDKAYKTKSKIKYLSYMAAISALGKKKKNTLRKEVIDTCGFIEAEASKSTGKLSFSQISDATSCYIDGWPYTQSQLLSQIMAEHFLTDEKVMDSEAKINNSEIQKDLDDSDRAKKVKPSGATVQ